MVVSSLWVTWGISSRTRRKSAPPISSTRQSPSATIVAERGAGSSRDISPAMSPGDIECTLRPLRRTTMVPSSSTIALRPAEPCSITTVPAGTVTSVPAAATVCSSFWVRPANSRLLRRWFRYARLLMCGA